MNIELYKQIVAERKREGCSGLMNIFFLGDDHYTKSGSTGCTAGLRSTPGWSKYLVSALNGLQDNDNNSSYPEQEMPIVREYIDWLVNESPYAPTYVSKDVDKILEDGVFVQDITMDNRLVTCGAIAQRFLYESSFTDLKHVWKGLVNEGVNKAFAFVVSYMFSYKEGIVTVGKERWGHTEPSRGRLSKNSLKKFLTSREEDWDAEGLNKRGTPDLLRAAWLEDMGESYLPRIFAVEIKGESEGIESVFSKGWKVYKPFQEEESFEARTVFKCVAKELIKIEKELLV